MSAHRVYCVAVLWAKFLSLPYSYSMSKRERERENFPLSTIGWTMQIIIPYQLVNALQFPHNKLLPTFQECFCIATATAMYDYFNRPTVQYDPFCKLFFHSLFRITYQHQGLREGLVNIIFFE